MDALMLRVDGSPEDIMVSLRHTEQVGGCCILQHHWRIGGIGHMHVLFN